MAAVTDAELEALDALDGGGEWAVDGVTLSVSNLDKVLFPARGDEPPVTKRDLLRYLARAADALLPYLEGRPCNAVRHPEGVDAEGFWAKAAPKRAPTWMAQWSNADAAEGETRSYVVVDRPATLLYLGNLAVVELHPWTSSCARSHEPDWALIDLDPGEDTTFEQVVTLARLHHAALDQLGVAGAAKVTGKRGIQIWVPVGPGTSFSETQAWVEALSRLVGDLVPDLVSWAWSKADRKGRARLDYTQNARNKTLVAPFSPRAAAGAPVSVPIGWDELDDLELAPDRWTVRTALDHLAARGDPLRDLIGLDQRLPPL
ncbi:MAG: hypothetical protein KDA97_12040 [Acidimicrobiales bacterium]|nr:hypothetical protein [Acidimicrobiales bacterium]